MSALTLVQDHPARWWHTAPTPPCVSWCAGDHRPGEFQRFGGFTCSKPITVLPAFEVHTQAWVGVADDDVPGAMETEVAEVYVENLRGEYTPEEARTFAMALLEAAIVCERAVRHERLV